MSDLRPKPPEIELGGKKYGILFNLNAIDEIQDRFDIPISKLDVLLKDERKVFKVLKSLLAILINEAIDDSESGDPHVDEKYIGRKITVADIPTLKDKVFSAFTAGIPESDESDPTTSE
jgi:hypothetical protein